MSGDDSLSATAATTSLRGQSGDDDLHGNEGDDRLSGQFGDDTVSGGKGDDMMSGRHGEDRLRRAFRRRLTGRRPGRRCQPGGPGTDYFHDPSHGRAAH